MEQALRLIEREGLDALSMRRLGTELGVEAMALYRYVDAKGALLDGVSAQLWSEVRIPDEHAPDWKQSIRETAHSLRGLMQAYPNAFPLLLGRRTLSEPALRVFVAMIRAFHNAGFDDSLAGQALGTVVAYSVGYAIVELTCGLGRPDLAAPRCSVPGPAARFADVSKALARCDPDAQFAFGLDALLRGH
ncbi:MAG: TetR/AcrR family transcriptional regulator [bacterium]